MSKKQKLALIGFGRRAYWLIQESLADVLNDNDFELAAVCDLYEDRIAEAQQLAEEFVGAKPYGTTDYRQILADPEITAVIITAAWEAHIDMAIDAMRAGKHVGLEVGGAYCLEDCWRLIRAHEETGIHCMMLENCCYGRDELMVLNMVRQGLFGDVVHCAGGYQHDLRDQLAGGKENRHYRLRNYMNRNCENYPTHELGPIGKVLDINNGNRLVTLTATASCAKGLNTYVAEHHGADHPLATAEIAQGDIVTTVIKCAKGQTIVLTLDTSLPRAYSRAFTVRGTKGSFFEDNRMVFLDNAHHEHENDAFPIWNNAQTYREEYDHPIWKDYTPHGGHEGMDYLVFDAFLEAIAAGKRPPIDTYDTATYMCITPLTEESILKGSAPVMIPDFTRGKWYYRDDIADLKYNLDRLNACENYYDNK